MIYYIRTTHDFHPIIREWIYRDINKWGQNLGEPQYEYTLGVHALEHDTWLTIDEIVENTIKLQLQDAYDASKFRIFMSLNFDYKEILKQNISNELEYYVNLDAIRKKEIKTDGTMIVTVNMVEYGI